MRGLRPRVLQNRERAQGPYENGTREIGYVCERAKYGRDERQAATSYEIVDGRARQGVRPVSTRGGVFLRVCAARNGYCFSFLHLRHARFFNVYNLQRDERAVSRRTRERNGNARTTARRGTPTRERKTKRARGSRSQIRYGVSVWGTAQASRRSTLPSARKTTRAAWRPLTSAASLKPNAAPAERRRGERGRLRGNRLGPHLVRSLTRERSS